MLIYRVTSIWESQFRQMHKRAASQKDTCVDISTYRDKITEKLMKWLDPFLRETEPSLTNKRCCISISSNKISLLCINLELQKITFMDEIAYDNPKDLALVLDGIIERNGLENISCFWLLTPDLYELNLIDSLPVPEDEFETALSWRIRSLINYPMDEAILEYFKLPAKRSSPNSPLIAAVSAQKTKLNKKAEILKDSDLQLSVIDIPELALLNLAAPYEVDEKSTAFLYLYEKFLILNISCKKTLYFTRHIEFTHDKDGNVNIEALALEVMRYMDFFQSQWRLPAPSRMFIAGTSSDLSSTAAALTERLPHEVKEYSIPSDSLDDESREHFDNKYLLDYGCLLRKGGI